MESSLCLDDCVPSFHLYYTSLVTHTQSGAGGGGGGVGGVQLLLLWVCALETSHMGSFLLLILVQNKAHEAEASSCSADASENTSTQFSRAGKTTR